MTNDQQLATMPISDAVNQPGGNGLASPAFETPLNFFGVFGWQNVEAGVEALISDGKLVPYTRTMTDFLRILGRRRFMRRVLLKPAPLEVRAEGLTADQLRLSLEVAVKFEVGDPVHVASLENPLSELTNVAVGIISEYIRTRALTDLMKDSGRTRRDLLAELVESTCITRHYHIVEVQKALPTGDERLIEIKREEELAQAEAGLLEARGENEEITARHQAEIARGEAEIQDEFAKRDHWRRMERADLEGRIELVKTAVETLGQVAAGGIDPTPLAQDFIARLTDQASHGEPRKQRERPPGSAEITTGQRSQVEQEREMLESIKESVGIVAYDVAATGEQVKGAVIQMPEYEIVFACDMDYPDTQPQVMVRFRDGRSMQPALAWASGVTNSMAQAVLVIVAQAPQSNH